MFRVYPYDVDYHIGDLVMLCHTIEFLGDVADKGEIGVIVKIYNNSRSHYIYDCRVLLKCLGEIDCWFGELINLTRLES